jgi:hypothetical protein
LETEQNVEVLKEEDESAETNKGQIGSARQITIRYSSYQKIDKNLFVNNDQMMIVQLTQNTYFEPYHFQKILLVKIPSLSFSNPMAYHVTKSLAN